MDPGPEPDEPDESNPDDQEKNEPDDSGSNNSAPTNLSSMTKAQLLDYAEKTGIQGVNSEMKKADIISAIGGV